MADTKHTPGPWATTGNLIEGSDGETIAYVTAYNTLTPKQQANARLLAASPEMLAVLKTTLGNIMSLGPAGALESVPMPFRVWAQVVSDVIAKAEGR
jgi:hypothetical protein